ncbi:MAG: UvrB/UvrC motif-containing protein [Candidatus Omnitrophota bacterium]|nr:UvrB/UvrC motif-containing protein [Candidatus Omnitrophota bacterium]
MQKEMQLSARNLQFERAAELRDKIRELRKEFPKDSKDARR